MAKEVEMKFVLSREQYETLIKNKTETHIIRNYYFDTGSKDELLRLRTTDDSSAVITLKRKISAENGVTQSVETDFYADITALSITSQME